MIAKQYLRTVRNMDLKVNSKLEQLENLRTIATKITIEPSEKIQTSPKNDKFAETMAKIVDLQREVNSQIDELIDAKMRICRLLKKMENDDYKLLLEMRYLNFKTWEKIAVDMGYSYRNIHYLHGKALKKFESISNKSI